MVLVDVVVAGSLTIRIAGEGVQAADIALGEIAALGLAHPLELALADIAFDRDLFRRSRDRQRATDDQGNRDPDESAHRIFSLIGDLKCQRAEWAKPRQGCGRAYRRLPRKISLLIEKPNASKLASPPHNCQISI
jgi:hypothetical protein